MYRAKELLNLSERGLGLVHGLFPATLSIFHAYHFMSIFFQTLKEHIRILSSYSLFMEKVQRYTEVKIEAKEVYRGIKEVKNWSAKEI
jgi:hypothetical protein